MSITPISILNRIGAPGAPSTLGMGELAYNQPSVTEPNNRSDVLYVGDGASVLELVGAARQLELWGNQTILPGSQKTISVNDLKLTGGQPDWLLTTDGNGNISWTNAPGGGLTQVATDGVTLAGLGTSASPLSVVPHTVAVTTDSLTIQGNGTTAQPLAVIHGAVAMVTDGVTINGNGTTAQPLAVAPNSVPVATTGASLTGNGTTGSPLAVVANSVPVATNNTLSGNGTTASPLGVVADTVAVMTDGITIQGNGTTALPLKAVNGTVAIATDGVTLGGSGVTASPLHVMPNTVPVATNATLTGNGTTASPLGVVAGSLAVTTNATLTGNGTSASPLGLATPVTVANGGTGAAAGNTALDNLAGQSGSNAGLLQRSSGGAWSTLVALPLPVAQGGTGAATAAAALTALGAAPLASPAMTGTPTVPTATPSTTNTQQAASTAFVQAAIGTALGPLPTSQNVGRNYADNALFNVAQRGAGPFTAQNAYTADRWQLQYSLDSNSVTVVSLTDAQRAAIGDESAIFGLQNVFTGNSGSLSYSCLVIKIEKVRRLSGKTVTVSFFAQASASGLQMGVQWNQNFGSGGSPSALVQGTSGAVTLATSFARYSVTLNVASAAGKTFGTNGDDSTSIILYYSAGSASAAYAGGIPVQSGTVTLWGVQVEIGSQPTPLEKRDPQSDLANCQRFYQVFNAVIVSGYNGANGAVWGYFPYATTMRATPTVTFGTISYSNASNLRVNLNTWFDIQLGLTITATALGYAVCQPVTMSADL